MRTYPRSLPSGPVVVYGDAWGSLLTPPAEFQCASEQVGMICTDYQGHGFTMNRKLVQTW